jgi:hypothetical protein
VERKDSRLFVAAGLLIAIGLGLLVGPWASPDPDGLERVAADHGFTDEARQHPLGDSPVADYRIKGFAEERLGTALSALIGICLTFGLGLGLFGLIRVQRRGRSLPEGGPR